MSDTPRTTLPRNRDIVLPPLVRSYKDGHSTLEQVLEAAYEHGLGFGYEAGVQEAADE